MTFTEIVAAVAERLNLSSTDALARIGRNVNYRYKRLTSSVGLQPTRRATVNTATVSGNPRITFSLEKLETVYITDTGRRRVLSERSYDEWRNNSTWSLRSGDPEEFAIESMDASTITIVLSPVPSAIMTVYADGLENATTLSGANVPEIPASFHDTLVDGAIADEYQKLENVKQAQEFENRYEMRASELRYHIAKSSYLQRVQGNRSRVAGPSRQSVDWYK